MARKEELRTLSNGKKILLIADIGPTLSNGKKILLIADIGPTIQIKTKFKKETFMTKIFKNIPQQKIYKRTHLQTKDYSMFVHLDGNRGIDEKIVEEKIQSLIKDGQLVPIVCIRKNGKLGIVEGQHRLEACKRLDYEIIVDILEDVTTSEVDLMLAANGANVALNKGNFIKLFVEKEDENYINLTKCMSDFPYLDNTVLYGLISGSSTNFANKIKHGEISFKPNVEQLYVLRAINDLTAKWISIRKGRMINGGSRMDYFNKTLAVILTQNEIDFDDLMIFIEENSENLPANKFQECLLNFICEYEHCTEILLEGNAKNKSWLNLKS